MQYHTQDGKIPQDWLTLSLPKSKNTKKGNDFRLISLISYIIKLFIKIIIKFIKSMRKTLAQNNLVSETVWKQIVSD